MAQPETFGQWLRKRRKLSLDLTQEELADRIGCSPETIRKYESGERRPSKHTAEVIGQGLGVPQEEWADLVRFARQAPHDEEPDLPDFVRIEGLGAPAAAARERTNLLDWPTNF